MNNSKETQVRRKLMGDNGFGPHVFDDSEAPEVQRQLQHTLDSVAIEGLKEEDLYLLAATSRHLDAGTFSRITGRRGKEWRIVSALADRLNELEGKALIRLAGATHAANLDLALAVKVIHMSRRLDAIAAATAYDTPETKDLVDKGLQGSRGFFLRVWENTREDFMDDVRNRTSW